MRILVGKANFDREVAGLRFRLLRDVHDLAHDFRLCGRIGIFVDCAGFRLLTKRGAHQQPDETEHVDLLVEIDNIGDRCADSQRLAGHDLDSAHAPGDRRG